jgi:8-oxo-dGTP diphosphatase
MANFQPEAFGIRITGVTYKPRPAAYAVIRGIGGTIAVVRTKRGYFLPGGGSLPGEAPDDTVRREVREELAQDVEVIRKVGETVQYFSVDGQHYRMEAIFFAAEFSGEPEGEGEYRLHWLDPDKLEGAFFHESHRWAVDHF